MEQAMHAARLAAAQSALLALLIEAVPGLEADSVQVTLTFAYEEGTSLDVVYSRSGVVVGGEGA